MKIHLVTLGFALFAIYFFIAAYGAYITHAGLLRLSVDIGIAAFCGITAFMRLKR
jgi:hypothetical protein